MLAAPAALVGLRRSRFPEGTSTLFTEHTLSHNNLSPALVVCVGAAFLLVERIRRRSRLCLRTLVMCEAAGEAREKLFISKNASCHDSDHSTGNKRPACVLIVFWHLLLSFPATFSERRIGAKYNTIGPAIMIWFSLIDHTLRGAPWLSGWS